MQGPLVAFEIAGPLDFSTVGVLSGLLEPLAKQGISILALSTYDTDWILIEAQHADEAMATWKRDGNTAAPARLGGADLMSVTTPGGSAPPASPPASRRAARPTSPWWSTTGPTTTPPRSSRATGSRRRP